MPDERLFIKVILPKQGKETKVPPGGSPARPFKLVDDAFRTQLIDELGAVADELQRSPAESPFVTMKVQLESKATAKSHRPDDLFLPAGCPIIGTERPGQLYVQASRPALAALRIKIARGSSKSLVKSISTLKSISPVGPTDRLAGLTPQGVLETAPRNGDGARSLIKLRMFRYPDNDDDNRKQMALDSALKSAGVPWRRLGNAKEQEVYVVECGSREQVDQLSRLVMVRSIEPLPTYRLLRGQSLGGRPLPQGLLAVAPSAIEHPVVAVVDSGITPHIPPLQPWIFGRESFVAPAEVNLGHGTFVAGLLVWGHELNVGIPEIEPLHCRLLDVQVLPNNDPARGPVGRLNEEELLQSLEYCLIKYANEVKVWNLSLGSDEICSLDHFSTLAVEFDDLQERFNVSFVIAAGNYEQRPFLPFPRNVQQSADGRITTPADSVLGLAVGSVAQTDLPPPNIRRGQPSPFSRNGPGPNHIIKPDLVHLGGNLGSIGQPVHGLTSLDIRPGVVENVGTSFATPLVSRQLAHVYHSITPTPSATIARSILTHCARDLRTRDRIPEGEDHYFGFGTPLAIRSALECTPWAMTLVFEEQLRPGYFLEWDNFPYPSSLSDNGRFRGEIAMTLAYPPRRNADFGAEYCETHVEASFGVFIDKDGEEKFVGQVPVEHRRADELYETFQVSRLRKWAPVRTFYNKFPNGIGGKRWRLKVRLLCRHDVGANIAVTQPFGLVLTIADPDRRAPVYDEMARILRGRFQTQNLALRPTVRVQPQAGG